MTPLPPWIRFRPWQREIPSVNRERGTGDPISQWGEGREIPSVSGERGGGEGKLLSLIVEALFRASLELNISPYRLIACMNSEYFGFGASSHI